MAIQFGDLISEPASNKPTAGGTFNLSGTASSGFEKFDSQITSGNQVICSAKSSAGQMEFIGTYTNAATDTITVDALRHSSTGALIDFSGGDTVVIENVLDASIGNQLSRVFTSSINGLGITYSSTTAFIVEAGDLVIDNKQYSAAQTTLTSASTMKDLAGSTVTLGASKAYFIYAYNNAGTLEFRVQDRTGSGNGVDPTYNADNGYWLGPVAGSRRIGKIFTDASSQIINFRAKIDGKRVLIDLAPAISVLSNGTSTTVAAVTITPYVSSADFAFFIGVGARRKSGSAAGFCQPLIYIDGGTNFFANIKGYASNELISIAFGNQYVPVTGSLHYKCNESGADASITLQGVELYR